MACYFWFLAPPECRALRITMRKPLCGASTNVNRTKPRPGHPQIPGLATNAPPGLSFGHEGALSSLREADQSGSAPWCSWWRQRWQDHRPDQGTQLSLSQSRRGCTLGQIPRRESQGQIGHLQRINIYVGANMTRSIRNPPTQIFPGYAQSDHGTTWPHVSGRNIQLCLAVLAKTC